MEQNTRTKIVALLTLLLKRPPKEQEISQFFDAIATIMEDINDDTDDEL